MNINNLFKPRSLLNLLVAAVGLGALAVGAFYLSTIFASRSTPTGSQPQQPAVQQQISATAIPATNQADPTAGWEEYKNANQGYVIKYPADWYLYPYGDYVGTASVISSIDVTEGDQSPMGMPIFPGELVVSIGLSTDSKQPDQNLMEWLESRKSSIAPLTEPVKIISIVGTIGVRTVTKNVFGDEKYSIITVYFPRDNNVFFISASPANSPYIDVFELMLGTFQFIK